MNNRVLVVMDLAGFKAFRVDDSALYSSPRLELMEEFSNADAHTRLVEKVSDMAGRFPRSGGGGAMADGERHNIELEQRRRFVRLLAQRLNALLGNGNVDRCYLAVSREINHHLLDELDPRVRAKIDKMVPADLTKTDKSELLRHFR